jgi:Tfp pilus assembly protein PilX
MTNTRTSIYGKGRHHQGGYATLGIAVVLLLVLSLITVYLTRSGIIDIRTSANKARYAQALTDAERKLEIGLGWLSSSTNRVTLLAETPLTSWVTCNTLTSLKVQELTNTWLCRPRKIDGTLANLTITPPETAFVIATPNTTKPEDLGKTYFVVAEGSSVDGSASAVVKQGVYFYASNNGAANAPPMMGAGNIPLNGNYTIVANPNSGGKGVPVSVWSKIPIANLSGTAATCQLGEYVLAGNNCTGAAVLSSSTGKGPDIVDNDPDFPADVFQYLFGVPSDAYGIVKAQAKKITDCSNLAGLSGTVWVTGDCTIASNSVVGSAAAPLQLIVESGAFTMNANSTFYGLLFAFGPPPSPYNAGSIQANGGAKFYGSMISNDTTDMGLQINGTFDMVYSKNVMDIIANGVGYKTMARIPGSWTDFLTD